MKKSIAALAVAFCAGVTNGLVGTGGGVVLVLGLTPLLPIGSRKEIFRLVPFIIFALSAVSATVYALRGQLPLGAAAPFLIPAAVGGFIGAWLLRFLRMEWLQLLFSVLLLFSGGRLLLQIVGGA